MPLSLSHTPLSETAVFLLVPELDISKEEERDEQIGVQVRQLPMLRDVYIMGGQN